MVKTLDGGKKEWGWPKAKLGANATLAISMAVCRAGAAASEVPLYLCISKLEGKPTDKCVMPTPSLSVINGGSLAGNRMACQEFMIVPTRASGSAEAMITGTEVHHTLKSSSRRSTGKLRAMVSDQGCSAPRVQDSSKALDLLADALEKSGH